ncbi:glycoside hydrolase family 1 protein [Clostridium botulinum]|uniref:glycoside hydrolase family 1 protein n=1 Tax=Clostridium sporogenes TaxID=1509 RepID=UPI00223745D6|nr:glycoside hydrolase family 1 protein [Clostridium sporogenes]EKO1912660.1 glycoside hydrolase family 1 protein [Clostridium botulinum]EKO2042721.1 glycoside hydrolase family 1 protein [Clostridium botulinum]MCW6073952.1 glycoside hydrolase family 1 protein [Clostridium sporogenes]
MRYKNPKAFPDDFLWAAATAAYQFEGAYLEDGKTMSIVDANINPNYANTSVTSDHYHRFNEDIKLMKELGIKAYRFSISWPRVLPNGRGKINEKGINFYKQLVKELKDNDIEPLATIYHFDLPLCLQEEYGGWCNRKIIDDFTYYCEVLFKNLGQDIKYWFTINEQSNMFLLPYLMVFNNEIPLEKQKYEMNHIMMLAHAKAIKLFREIVPTGKIGPAIGISPNYPKSCRPEDIQAAKEADDFRTYLFTDLYVHGYYRKNVWRYMQENNIAPTIKNGDMELITSSKPDFLGVNYYQSRVVGYAPENAETKDVTLNTAGKKGSSSFEIIPGLYEGTANPYLEKTDWDWELDPIGLRIMLNDLNDRYHLPIIITENGIGGIDTLTNDNKIHDEYRINFLKNHLKQCNLAINDGVNLFGYCPWSFMDLLSTTSGFRKRYGFIYVNRNDTNLMDLRRIKKDSFYWYKDVINSKGQNL